MPNFKTNYVVLELQNPLKRLEWLLYLVAIHSLFVGIALIIHPASVIAFFGYAPITEHFFPVQGGIFHVIMAIGYTFGARDMKKHRCLIVFAIIIKTFATIFLIIYFVFVDHILMVLLSGFADGLMAILIYFAFKTAKV